MSKPDTKATRERAVRRLATIRIRGDDSARAENEIALCDRVEALEAALRDVERLSTVYADAEDMITKLRAHARAALDGGS